MNLYTDERIVMTLDAGGTNFVFSAWQSGKELIEPITFPSNPSNLEACLKIIIEGFKTIEKELLPEEPSAISFAFPGPADYKNGIIGDLPNFPSFRGGVALGPMLEDIFDLPTFINNDGDLFTYGEAMGGILPEINKKLKEKNIDKEYKNLLGVTLGTGFGGGIVINNQLSTGDNSASGEIWLTRNFKNLSVMAEEGISIRAIQRSYKEISGTSTTLHPKEIYDIALGIRKGNQEAAIHTFEKMAEIIGESLANAITLIDGPIVIGGGIAGASRLIIPKIVEHLNGIIKNQKGDELPRLVSKVYNIDDPDSYENFLNWKSTKIKVPFQDKKIIYNSEKKIALGISRLGTSQAVCLGAYAFALDNLDIKAAL